MRITNRFFTRHRSKLIRGLGQTQLLLFYSKPLHWDTSEQWAVDILLEVIAVCKRKKGVRRTGLIIVQQDIASCIVNSQCKVPVSLAMAGGTHTSDECANHCVEVRSSLPAHMMLASLLQVCFHLDWEDSNCAYSSSCTQCPTSSRKVTVRSITAPPLQVSLFGWH